MLSEAGKARLLQIARDTLERIAQGQEPPTVEEVEEAELLAMRGVFVTLRKGGHLRGCIGFAETNTPLFQTVMAATVASATRDPRFEPVTEEERADVRIEISVLSTIESLADVNLIAIGRHGLVVQAAKGQSVVSGLLLPQVASEHGWSREEFLRQTCLKAGLPADEWQQGAEVFSFTAEVFGEPEI